ncbi:L-xylulose reductase-like isoform X2 [Sycon ciliatum]|uniref:L-xylulose reductase-like isoform X2 n=1 Tax=Sycon ciliatum TaxID=27933 RepID=UPI0020AE8F5A
MRVVPPEAQYCIGGAVCLAAAKEGAHVAVISKSSGSLEALGKQNSNIQLIQADLGEGLDAIRKAVSQVGHVDGLVNNAAVADILPFVEVTEESYDKQMDVNVKAVFFVGQCVAKAMVEQKGGGAIVNVSSQASMRAISGHSVYGTSKGAVDNLTRVMALELGPHKIRVNSVNPTVVLTAMGRENWSDPAVAKPMLDHIPLGRFAEVSEVVDPILYLLSDRSTMITGTMLPVDGGFTAC